MLDREGMPALKRLRTLTYESQHGLGSLTASLASKMDPMNFLEVSDILELLSYELVLNEDEFKELVTKRPKLMIRVLKKFEGKSLKKVRVRHQFVSNKHHLEFNLEIDLLLKLVLSLDHFNGSLSEAKELTNLLLQFGCNLNLLPSEYYKYMKLFAHNIAISLCSIHDRIGWQFKYIWFLAKKPEFRDLNFKELPDYWSCAAIPILRRINYSRVVTVDKCRRFVQILLISGNYPNFNDEIRPESLEQFDLHSLRLLLHFGFDFRKCLKTHCNIEDNLIDDNNEVLLQQCPRLMRFLTEVQYFNKPLPLKDLIRIGFQRRHGFNLDRVAKQLKTERWIPEGLCDYLRYKYYIDFQL